MTTAPLEEKSGLQAGSGKPPLHPDQLYRVVLSSLPTSAVIVFDHNLRYVLVDGHALAEAGLDKESMEGKTLAEIDSPEAAARAEDPYRAALNGETVESEAVNGDNTFAVRFTPLYDDDGRVYAGLCTMTDITPIKAAEHTAQQRLRELEVVSEVSSAASSVLNIADLLRLVSNLTKERFNFYHAHIYLLDDEDKTLVLAAGAGDVGAFMVRRAHRIALNTPRSLVARAARTGKGTVVNDVMLEPDYLPNPMLPETRSEMALPMIAGGTTLGVLDIQDGKVARFNEDDIRVFSALANQIAIAVQNARRFEQVKLYQDIAQNMTSGLYVYHLEKPDDPQSLRMVIANPKAGDLTGVAPQAIMGRHIGEAFPNLLETDIPQTYAELAKFGGEWSSEDLYYGDNRVVSSAYSVKAFGLPGNQVGVTFENITARIAAEQESERIRKQNEILAHVTSLLSQAEDENSITGALRQLVAGSPALGLITLGYVENDSSGNPLEVQLTSVMDAEGNVIPLGMLPATRLKAEEYPFLTLLYQSPNAALVFSDLNDLPNMTDATRTAMEAFNVHSGVMFPLRAGATWIGVVSILWSAPHEFSAYDQQVFQGILPALNAVVANRRQYLQTAEAERMAQRLSRNLQTVSEISTRISNILDLDQMLTTASDLIKSRFNRYHAHVYLLDETGEKLVLAAGAGSAGQIMKGRRHSIPVARENSLVARAARTRLGVIENDVIGIPDFLPNPLLPETQAEMAIPLIVAETLIGVLDVQANETDAFDAADVFIQTTLASQLATAIQNIRDVEQIRRSREQVARLYELADEMIGTATSEGYLRDLNPSWTRVLGWSAEELGSKPFLDFVHPDDRERTIAENARHFELSSPTLSFENRYAAKDGTYRWVLWNAVPERDTGLTHFVARDVTDRVQYEQAIERRARQLETVAEVSAAITTVFDRDELLQKVADLTKSAFNLYHAHVYLINETEEYLLLAAGAGTPGAMMKARGHRIALSHAHSMVARAARTKEIVIENDVNSAADFLPNPLLPDTRAEMAIPLLIGDRVLGILDVQSDVANAFHADDAKVLATLAAQIAVAVENTNVVQRVLLTERAVENSASGLTISDMTKPDVPVIYVNPAFEKMSGLTAQQWAGKGFGLLPTIGVNEQEEQEMRLAFTQGRQFTTTVTITRPDGTEFIDEISISPIFNARGQITHIVGVHTDTTERVALERQREESLRTAEETAERLREVDRLKSQFLANMSHELRTPLNSIIGYSEILLDGDDGELSEEAVEDVETIHNSGRHLLSLINDVLDLAKIEAGEMRLDRVACDVVKIANDVVHASQVLMGTKTLTLSVETIGDIHLAHADPVRVRQILMNLVSNAIKFTERGGVVIRLQPSGANRLEVSVTDTGMGIPQDLLGAVFEQFRQVDGSSTRRAGGTGLGLTITRHLVHMHQGEIMVESVVGQGSTFRFTLPFAELTPA